MLSSTRYCMGLALLGLVASLAACRTDKAAEKVTSSQAAPRTFQSPTEAGSALFTAAKAGDRDAMLAIFGPDAKQVLFSGDDVVDKNNRDRFCELL